MRREGTTTKWILVFLLVSGLMVYCVPLRAAEKVTLTFWNGFTGPDRPAVEALVEKFNETHPNIEVQMDIMPWDSLMQKLLSSMVVGREPDIAGVHFQYLPQFAKAGVIMPLDELYNVDGLDPAVFPPALIELMKYGGRMYAVPMNFATLMLYYNKSLFREAGLNPDNPPANWAEWQEAIIRLTQDKDSDGKIDQYGLALADHETIPMWPILVWGNGGDFVAPDGKKSMLDDPKTVEAVEVWASLIIKHRISPVGLTGAEADKLFETQKAAMEMNGPWMTTGYTKAGIEYDVAPIPEGPAGRVTLADSVLMLLNSKTLRKDAAYEFFKFWNSKESQIYWAVNTGFPPARIDLIDDPMLGENPFVPKFAAAAPYARFYLPGLENYAEIDTIIMQAIQEATRGLKSAEEALKEAAAKMNAVLAKQR
ncbi:MAG: ABC transporter substrate-binding protein [Candidatus Caldatribacterium sp.]|nr:ABC transporter substrate-binding protein [Candidatus Caldatribacterium sp.]